MIPYFFLSYYPKCNKYMDFLYNHSLYGELVFFLRWFEIRHKNHCQ